MLKILIADDHPIFRQGLKQIIHDTPGLEVADEAGTGQEALDKARVGDYDVVLLDISMPIKSGIDVLVQLKHARPTLPILMLSMHPEEQYAVRALREGASGYVTKESAPEELVAALHRVSQGGRYVSASLAERLASMLQGNEAPQPHDTLSHREYQVMYLLASGKTVSEAAQELVLSTKTVSTYRARVLKKLGLENNAELIRYAVRNHLVE
jgi:two-component system, NarL family, invasion response regulator UvrY